MKYLLRLDTILCTTILLGVIIGLSNTNINSELFDPVAKAFEDFEISDVVFSIPLDEDKESLRGKNTYDETDIVLVNIGFLDRGQIAKQIDVISSQKPAVIAIDAFFRKEKDPMKDFPLAMAMSNAPELVLVSEIHHTNLDMECFDSVSYSNPLFNDNATNGYANLVASKEGQGFRTVKSFSPFECVGDTQYPSFATRIVQLFDTAAYNRLVLRGHDEEVINWKGHQTEFYCYDAHQILEGKYDLSFLKDKIVLMGYIGPRLGEHDLIDIFYTPLNHRVAGRAYPDTYGVVVHANIISMILRDRYIFQFPEWANLLLMFVIVFGNIAFFVYIAETKKVYYDLITKSLQLFEIAFFMFLVAFVMLEWEVKVHIGLLFPAILFSGDFTELYMGSLKPLSIKWLGRLGLIKSKD